MFVSPFPSVLEARKTKALGELNLSPYPAQCGNCAAWLRRVFAAARALCCQQRSGPRRCNVLTPSRARQLRAAEFEPVDHRSECDRTVNGPLLHLHRACAWHLDAAGRNVANVCQVFVYACTHVCKEYTYAYIHAYAPACAHTQYAYAYIHVYARTHTHTHIASASYMSIIHNTQAHTHIHTLSLSLSLARSLTHAHTHARTHARTRTCTHTLTHIASGSYMSVIGLALVCALNGVFNIAVPTLETKPSTLIPNPQTLNPNS